MEGLSALHALHVRPMNKPWLITNLEDARQALARAISEIKTLDGDDDCIAQDMVGEAYVKLNYAWNSRAAPVGSSGDSEYDEWIKYPKEMDIYTGGDGKPSA